MELTNEEKVLVVSALKKVLAYDNKEENGGICAAISRMFYTHDILTKHEYFYCNRYLYDVFCGDFGWPMGKWEPRIKWIKQQIKTLENEINHIPIS